MPGKSEVTEIQGLVEFLRCLNSIEKELPKQLADASQQVARDWVAAAKGKANRPGANKAAQSLIVGGGADGAIITNDNPLFYGEEFGGQARPSTMQFPPHQGQRGYWFFPAARENADKFQKVWEAAIDEATKSWDHKE